MTAHVLMDTRRTRAHTGIERSITAWRALAERSSRPTSFFTTEDRHDRSPSLGEGRAIRRAVAAHGADGFHATYPYLVVPRGVPAIVTLHDTLLLDRRRPVRDVARAIIETNVRRSRALVTVSAYSRGQIASRLGVDAGRIHVVPNGVEVPAAPTAQPDQDRPYLLYVGNLRPYKHVPELVALAAGSFPQRGLRLIAVVSGDDDAIAALPVDPCVELRRGVGEAELAQLRDGALATVSLAAGEGFGLPPLEAAARGVPALLLDSGAHREVMGDDAAVYCADLAPETFVAALDDLLADRKDRARAARRRAESFTWQASWDRLTTVYDAVL